MKITILWGRSDTFDSGKCKSVKGDFSGGRISSFLAVV